MGKASVNTGRTQSKGVVTPAGWPALKGLTPVHNMITHRDCFEMSVYGALHGNIHGKGKMYVAGSLVDVVHIKPGVLPCLPSHIQ